LLITVSSSSNTGIGSQLDDIDSMMMDGRGQRFRFTDNIEEEDSKQFFDKVYFERPNEATDILNLARSLFDLREYRKCVHVLKPIANPRH
jgi:hypothetical protein